VARQKSMAAPKIPVRLLQTLASSLALYWLLVACFPIFEPILGEAAYRVEPSDSKIIYGSIFVSFLSVVLASFVPTHHSVTGFFSHMIFCLVFVPICVVYGMSGGATSFLVACAMGLGISYMILGRQVPCPAKPNKKVDVPIIIFFAVYSILGLIYLLVQGMVRFSPLDFQSVYALRAEGALGKSAIAARWVPSSAYVASSFLIVFGIFYNNRWALLLGVGNSYILYNAFGFKLFLFVVPIVVGSYAYLKAKNPVVLQVGICLVMLVSFSCSELSSGVIQELVSSMNEVVIRRFIYAQPYLAFAWYDTLVDEPMVMLSHLPLISKVASYPFDKHYVFIVADEIFGRVFVPNTGVFGSGYANFGLSGVPIFVVAVFAMLKYIDETSVMAQSPLLVFGSLMPSVLFFEAEPVTCVTTFGLGLVLVICWIVRRYVSRSGVMSAPFGADPPGRAT